MPTERAGVFLPQHGGCLCGDVRYSLAEEPLTLYACHCTDCQRQTGSSFALSLVVRRNALQIVRGRPQEYALQLSDGRTKRSSLCSRCSTRIWNPSSVSGLAVLEAGTLDDTSWLRPVGHIWTRSAQPWFEIPEGALDFPEQPRRDEALTLVRAWKEQRARWES